MQENIDYFCSLYVSERARRRALVEEAIEFVELEEFARFRPGKLSGGLLRRLNIACGIVHKPDLVFFDEPTVAVDPQSRNAILVGIQRLRAEGATVVYTCLLYTSSAPSLPCCRQSPCARPPSFRVALSFSKVLTC